MGIKHTRRDFLRGMAAGATLAALGPISCKTEKTADRKLPNIVILLADDLGYSDLGAFGSQEIQTPSLDRLGSQGAKFTSFYAAAPNCSPSRAGLLTGRVPARTGIYNYIRTSPGYVDPQYLPASEITISRILKESGYDTCHVGKWHLSRNPGDTSLPQPVDFGFDFSLGTANNAIPSHENPTNYFRNGKSAGELAGFSCDLIVKEAMDWLDNRDDKDNPFFLYACFHEAHTPYSAPEDKIAKHLPKGREPSKGELNRAKYNACIENMDAAIGRLLVYLDQNGLSENTFILFFSDNGSVFPASNGSLRGRKSSLWEGGIRVPGIIRWPGNISGGSIIEEPVSAVDILPTLCGITGVSIPGDRPIDGQDIQPLFNGGRMKRETPLFWYFYRHIEEPNAALREGEWVLLGYHEKTDLKWSHPLNSEWMEWMKKGQLVRFELFNTADDLKQENDLSHREPERLERMKQRMIDIHKSVVAEGPVWNF